MSTGPSSADAGGIHVVVGGVPAAWARRTASATIRPPTASIRAPPPSSPQAALVRPGTVAATPSEASTPAEPSARMTTTVQSPAVGVHCSV